MTELTQQESVEQAFKMIVEVLDAGMRGQFPLGMAHVETHLNIKGAMEYLADQLRTLFPEEAPERTEAEVEELIEMVTAPQPECEDCEPVAEPEVTLAKPAQPNLYASMKQASENQGGE